LKKNLQNIEHNLEELKKLQSLLKDLLKQNGHSNQEEEAFKDLANAIEHYRDAYLEF